MGSLLLGKAAALPTARLHFRCIRVLVAAASVVTLETAKSRPYPSHGTGSQHPRLRWVTARLPGA